MTPRVCLDELDAARTAVIVHAAPDNLAHIPAHYRHAPYTEAQQVRDQATLSTGDAGSRVACGVVPAEPASPATGLPARRGGARAVTELRTVDGTPAGTVQVRQLADRVQVTATASGLPAGFHGFRLAAAPPAGRRTRPGRGRRAHPDRYRAVG